MVYRAVPGQPGLHRKTRLKKTKQNKQTNKKSDIYIYIYAYICVCIYIHVYIYTHIHIYSSYIYSDIYNLIENINMYMLYIVYI